MQAIIQGCCNMYQKYNSFYKIMLNVFIINNSAINEDKLFILHRSHLVTVFLIKKNYISKNISTLPLIKKKTKKNSRDLLNFFEKKIFKFLLLQLTYGKTLQFGMHSKSIKIFLIRISIIDKLCYRITYHQPINRFCSANID